MGGEVTGMGPRITRIFTNWGSGELGPRIGPRIDPRSTRIYTNFFIALIARISRISRIEDQWH